jgi:PAS domain S-box-containing protein
MKTVATPGSPSLDLLIDAIVDYAIFMLDTDGVVRSWNKGAERLKGYVADEIIGKSFATFYTQGDREKDLPRQALATAAVTGRFASEGWRVRKDGSRFWALVVLDAIRAEDGGLIGFAKVTRDITERQQAHNDLLESERRFRRLIEAVVDYAIFQLDPSGHVATWNPGAERIKGYRPQEIIGRHFSAFYTPEDLEREVPKMALAEAAEKGRFEAEGWRMRKDGTRFWASVVIDRITDEQGAIIGFAKVTRDLTERKQAQDELQRVQEQLVASQKLEAIGQLSGGIAHDFNNLLMIVLGNLENAERSSRSIGGPNLHRALANAKRGAQRAAALTSRLLAFSRRQALDPKPINLNSFLGGLQEFLQRTLGERLEVQTVGGAGLWQIEADLNHLESTIVNLAINARDAMPNGGKLTIEATNVSAEEDYSRANPDFVVGQYVVICVSDTGSGMSPEVLNHAFEPFFTTKEPGQGTGLGLSQVYGFVKQSGGHVKIYSEVGEGTSIKMYFPRYTGNHAQPASDNDDELISEGSSVETILVVEDDPDLRGYVSDVLRDLNYRVLSAVSAQAALTILMQENQQVDLLLTDVVMPGINGRELGRRAQEIRPHLRILYMTGYSRNAVVHHGRLDEGVDLLEKPVTQARLALKVREILDRNRD